MGVGQGKFYLPKAGLQRPAPQEAQTLLGDLERVLEAGGLEQEGGDQGALGVVFEQGFQMVLAGPEVVLELAEEPVEELAGRVAEVDPIMRKRDAQGLPNGFEM